MMQIIKKLACPVLFGSAVILAGCGGDDGPGGAGVPGNAVAIDDANAEAVIGLAFANVALFDTLPASTESPSVRQILAVAKSKMLNAGDFPQLATGATVSFSEDCNLADPADGNYVISGSETTNGTVTTKSGSITFNNCIIGTLTFSGSLSSNETDDSATGDYTENVSGSLTVNDVNAGNTISLNSLNFAESGTKTLVNMIETSRVYVTSAFTLSINFTVNGTSAGGFLIQLIDPIVESSVPGDTCPESGKVKITGANGTYAEFTYNGNGFTTVVANGTEVTTTGFCYN